MGSTINTKTVLLGATYFSVAYAASTAEECLILDRKAVVGSDFSDCMNAAPCREMPVSPLAEKFRSEMAKRNLLNTSGEIHVIPCATLLAKVMMEYRIPTLLETDVLSVTRVNDGFEVKIFNRDGIGTVLADRVIDTANFQTESSYRTLALMLVNGSKSLEGLHTERFRIQKGSFPDEFILHMFLTPDDTVLSARQKLFALIAEHDPALLDWQAATAASTFAFYYPEGPIMTETEPGHLHIPSASFGNLIQALEGGARYATAHTC